VAKKKTHHLEQNQIHHVVVKLDQATILRGLALTDRPSDDPYEFLLADVPYDERALRFIVGRKGTRETEVRSEGGNKRIYYRYSRTVRGKDYLVENDRDHYDITVREGVETTFTWRTDCGNASLDVDVTMHVYFLPSGPDPASITSPNS
jgi:hypothetical protein